MTQVCHPGATLCLLSIRTYPAIHATSVDNLTSCLQAQCFSHTANMHSCSHDGLQMWAGSVADMLKSQLQAVLQALRLGSPSKILCRRGSPKQVSWQKKHKLPSGNVLSKIIALARIRCRPLTSPHPLIHCYAQLRAQMGQLRPELQSYMSVFSAA